MSDLNRISPLALIDQYIRNTLSEEEACQLLNEVQRNEKISDLLVRNVLADLLLRDLFRSERMAGKIPPVSESSQFFGIPEIGAEPFPFQNSDLNQPITRTDPVDLSSPSSFFYSDGDQYIGRNFRKNQNRKRMIPILFGAAGLLLFILIASFAVWHKSGDSNHGSDSKFQEESFDPIARIEEVLNPVWSEEQFKRGQKLASNRISLTSGTVKLRMRKGAVLLLEGPGDYLLNEENKIFCKQGRLSALIPKEAIGFEVATPFSHFIDQGTEFSVDVGSDSAVLDVITGKVDVFRSIDLPVLRFLEGEACQLNSGNKIERIPLRPEQHLNEAKFMDQVRKDAVIKKQEKADRDRILDSNPNLLIRFEPGTVSPDGRIANLSRQGSGLVQFAQSFGSRAGEGARFDQKALEFTLPRHILSFDLPGNYKSITLTALIRIDALKNQGNILFASKNFMEEEGTFLWQISRQGELQFQITRAGKAIRGSYDSEPVFQPRLFGTWIFAALVIDGDRKTISHYADGRLVGQIPWDNPSPLKIGSAFFGNAKNDRWKNSDHYLGGAIQSCMIFDKALSPEETKISD
ncbi:MAG: LamG domain-containing protein [Planctomycetia bacterium]|nr:LamG domain-containing protein [Planctomycetia bacterium]